MICFVTVCIGENRRMETMHLLNDIRNLNLPIYLLTNLNFELERFQFDNVTTITNDVDYWTDYERFKVILKSLNDGYDYVYYLDCDSRFIDFRKEKFNTEGFVKHLDSQNFDIMCSWTTDPIRSQLDTPNPGEDKSIRNFKFGHEKVINYLITKYPNYKDFLDMTSPLEGVLIFKNNSKTKQFCQEVLMFYDVLRQEDIKFGRQNLALGGGLALRLFSSLLNLNLIAHPISYHFFKPNFDKEVFPFNFIINKDEKILFSNHILL